MFLPKSNIPIEKFKVGDLVTCETYMRDDSFLTQYGIVTETNINMWGEEVIPSGIEIFMPDGSIEVWPEDDLELVD